MRPDGYLAMRSPEYFESMLIDLLVIGSTHERQANVGVSVNAGGKKSTNGAGTNYENVQRVLNKRHTGTELSGHREQSST